MRGQQGRKAAGEEQGAKAIGCADADRAIDGAGVLRERSFQVHKFSFDAGGVFQKLAASTRQFAAGGAAVEQPNAEGCFKRIDAARNGGLIEAQFPGGRQQLTFAGDSKEHAGMVPVKIGAEILHIGSDVSGIAA